MGFRKISSLIPVITNQSRFNFLWNIFILLFILCFILMISYRVVFRVYYPDIFYWIMVIIFGFDLFINFFIDVRVKYKLLQTKEEIAKNYLKTYFIIDFLAFFPFGLLAYFYDIREINSDYSQCVLSVLYLFPLLKLLKIRRIFDELQESLNFNPNVRRLIALGFWFIIGVNFISLGWCMIGASEEERSFFDQYIRAVYWCLTTIATIGYGDYSPDKDSNLQIIYTIIVQIIGVGVFGYIIGNISLMIANIDMARAEFMKKLESVNVSMQAKNLPADLQNKVRNYYYYLWETRRGIDTKNMFEELPHTLTIEISLYLNKDIITKVPIFKEANEIFIREIVQILEPVVYLPDDYIITQGEYGDCMYFLSSGEVEIIKDKQVIAQLGAGSPFGETALLKDEKRTASVRAKTYCDLYRLSKENFDKLRVKYPEFDEQVKRIMLERLN